MEMELLMALRWWWWRIELRLGLRKLRSCLTEMLLPLWMEVNWRFLRWQNLVNIEVDSRFLWWLNLIHMIEVVHNSPLNIKILVMFRVGSFINYTIGTIGMCQNWLQGTFLPVVFRDLSRVIFMTWCWPAETHTDIPVCVEFLAFRMDDGANRCLLHWWQRYNFRVLVNFFVTFARNFWRYGWYRNIYL